MRDKLLPLLYFFFIFTLSSLLTACDSETLPREFGDALKEAREFAGARAPEEGEVIKEKVSEDADRLRQQSLEELNRLKELSRAEAERLRAYSREQSQRLREYSLEQGETLKEQSQKLWESEYGERVREYSAKMREETSIEYLVEVLDKPVEPLHLQKTLERLGNDNWDCFSVQSDDEAVTLYCKREPDAGMNLLMFFPLLRLILSPF